MKLVFLCMLLSVWKPIEFQSNDLYFPRNVQQAFEKGTRSSDGRPGENYWQNSGDYNINISFDPKTLLLSGKETIVYHNNSPDTLHKIVIHLYPDYYKKGLLHNYPIDEKDENEGVTVEQLSINGEEFDLGLKGNSERLGTNLTIFPVKKIVPESTASVQITWHYTVNKGSHNRTGEVDSSSFFLAYTFPRIAVYDDIDGWDTWSYIGLQEFYNDWGNFQVEISMPAGFVVWGTGELMNAGEVFDKKIFDKYQAALHSDREIDIINAADYKNGPVTGTNQQLTWKFSAKDVTDFAFALSDHYLWDGSSLVVDKRSGRRVFIDAAYNKDSKDFKEVASVSRKCIDIMSNTYPAVPFPFQHETIFNGLDEMEYPMMVNDNSTDSRKDMVQLTSHEIFHSYFPFYMGINETKYAWMDEGWATIGESIISPMLNEPEDEGIFMREKYETIAGTDDEVPMITNSELQTQVSYSTNSYGKPGIFYWTLQNLLGDEIFFRALHEYINRWHGKHPVPYDFFNTFNDVSAQDLSWFFKPWFFESGYPDLTIKEVSKIESGSLNASEKWNVLIERKGSIPVPVYLEFILQNNAIVKFNSTAAIWQDGKKEFTVEEQLPGKLKEIKLGNSFIPDTNKKDNDRIINNK
ncbi:MAG: M1 family metallopeptidase [Chitinophagales bacterium]|nr:M1 family metallopeptidase [Chitinophagales bacterium]